MDYSMNTRRMKQTNNEHKKNRPFPEKDFSSRKGVFCAKRKLVETAEFV